MKSVSPAIAILIALLSLLASAFVGYSHNDKAIGERMTAVETQQKNDGSSLQRVETKIDKLDDKVDQLVIGLLGKKP